MARHQLLLSGIVFLFILALLSSDKCCCKDSNSIVTRKDYCCAMTNEGIVRRTSGLWSSERRRLGALGSSPPRCTSKCGGCSPCKPVHVAVPPGTAVITEYYPEAWRCKCGKKLYLP